MTSIAQQATIQRGRRGSGQVAAPRRPPQALVPERDAVGLLSTTPDYLRFSQMLLLGGELNGVRILRAETVARMTANGLPDEILATRGGGAMGWGLANPPANPDSARRRFKARAEEVVIE